jgi:hypothetical protein
MLIMKNIFLLAAFTSIGLFTFAQDTKVINDKNAQKRSVEGFHGVSVGGGIDLYLSQGSEEAVAVSAADPEVRDRIRTEVENGILHIYLESKGFHWGNWSERKMKAYVSCKVIDELHASGGSDVYIENALKSDKLTMSLSGGSDLHGKMNVGELAVTQSGGSDSYLSGSTSRLTVHASGGSDFHGYDLPADDCRIEASGGSDVYLVVNKALDANASGGSDIHYKGSVAGVISYTSGGSGVSRKQ